MDGLRNKDKHGLKFAFPSAAFCENEYCRLLHLFVFSTFVSGSWKLQRSRLQTIICQTQRGSGKKPSLFTLDQHYQSHMKNEQSKKENLVHTHTHTHTHMRTQSYIALCALCVCYITSAYNSELFDPNCNMSPKPGPSTTQLFSE